MAHSCDGTCYCFYKFARAHSTFPNDVGDDSDAIIGTPLVRRRSRGVSYMTEIERLQKTVLDVHGYDGIHIRTVHVD